MLQTIESIKSEIKKCEAISEGDERERMLKTLKGLLKAAEFLESVESRYNNRQEEFNDYLDRETPEIFIKTCENTGTMRYLASHVLFKTDEVAYWEAFNEFYNDRVGRAYDLIKYLR